VIFPHSGKVDHIATERIVYILSINTPEIHPLWYRYRRVFYSGQDCSQRKRKKRQERKKRKERKGKEKQRDKEQQPTLFVRRKKKRNPLILPIQLIYPDPIDRFTRPPSFYWNRRTSELEGWEESVLDVTDLDRYSIPSRSLRNVL
jgi:hypothetical protein